MTRLLVIDDETRFVRALGISLRAHGYDVDVAETGEQGLRLARDRHPDLIILDLGLPGLDGVEVLCALREWTNVPVMVLSARDLEADKIEAFDAGADDFITKPFGMGELHARVRAALRHRVPSDAGLHHVLTEHFALDFDAKRVTTPDGEEIHLTPTEWRLLELLVAHEDHPLSSEQILRTVWGPQFDEEKDYVRIYLWALRHKLEPDPSTPRYLTTTRGLGYRFTRVPPSGAPVSARAKVARP